MTKMQRWQTTCPLNGKGILCLKVIRIINFISTSEAFNFKKTHCFWISLLASKEVAANFCQCFIFLGRFLLKLLPHLNIRQLVLKNAKWLKNVINFFLWSNILGNECFFIPLVSWRHCVLHSHVKLLHLVSPLMSGSFFPFTLDLSGRQILWKM